MKEIGSLVTKSLGDTVADGSLGVIVAEHHVEECQQVVAMPPQSLGVSVDRVKRERSQLLHYFGSILKIAT